MTTALPSPCASRHSTGLSCSSSTGRWRRRTILPTFEKALARLQVPCFNVLYGDRDGHIEYLYNGTVPRRAKGDLAYWAGVVPGDTSETLWNDYLTYDELPKVIDPPSGYVQNTNDPPWNAAWPNSLDPSKYPSYIAPATVRSAPNGRCACSTKTRRSPTTSSSSTSTRRVPNWRTAFFRICSTPPRSMARRWHKQAAQVLKSWDRQAEADSRGAVLFHAWATRFMGGPLMANQAGFAVPVRFEVAVDDTTRTEGSAEGGGAIG